MNNVPVVKLGIVAVSRDCFPMSLSASRKARLVARYRAQYGEIFDCPTIVENERDMKKALDELKAAGVNALFVYLGNFGPETPETLLAKYFGGPVMFAGAAEDAGDKLVGDRGDAYCGMLNASYNLKLRGIPAYIPEYPVGTPEILAEKLAAFVPIARAAIALKRLKVITFGPRPNDFLACNAPIKPLFDLGIEIEENSELDLFAAYNAHADDPRIEEVVADMTRELSEGNLKPKVLPKLAQYELTLLDWAEAHRGERDYVAFANKCWPAFQTQFQFVPCYVNGRLAAKGCPVACEVDIYGALSEYVGLCVSLDTPTLLDINNSVPDDMYADDIAGRFDYAQPDTFMGFHCGNTASGKLASCAMKYQLIMSRSLPVEYTEGTLEGDLVPGAVTLFRLQSTADGKLRAYVAQGEVLPVPTRSFGGIGVVAIPEMGRFYRHVLIEGGFPHHGAVAFGHHGRALYEVFKLLGVTWIGFNQPRGMRYPTENPFG